MSIKLEDFFSIVRLTRDILSNGISLKISKLSSGVMLGKTFEMSIETKMELSKACLLLGWHINDLLTFAIASKITTAVYVYLTIYDLMLIHTKINQCALKNEVKCEEQEYLLNKLSCFPCIHTSNSLLKDIEITNEFS